MGREGQERWKRLEMMSEMTSREPGGSDDGSSSSVAVERGEVRGERATYLAAGGEDEERAIVPRSGSSVRVEGEWPGELEEAMTATVVTTLHVATERSDGEARDRLKR